MERSFGFIRCEGKDYFFHLTSFVNEDDFFDAVAGTKLEFTPKVTEKGDQATEIILIRK